MDGQMNSKLLDKILEDDMTFLSDGKSVVDLLGPDRGLDLEKDLDTTKPYSIIDKPMDGSPTHPLNTNIPQTQSHPPYFPPSLIHYPPRPPIQHTLL